MRFARQHPDQRVEPEQGCRDTCEKQFDPVHPSDVRKLMGDDRFEREFLWIGVALKRLRKNRQQVPLRRDRQAVLRAAGSAVRMLIFYPTHKAHAPRDAQPTSAQLSGGKRRRTAYRHWHSLWRPEHHGNHRSRPARWSVEAAAR